jgi:hypothetical protein
MEKATYPNQNPGNWKSFMACEDFPGIRSSEQRGTNDPLTIPSDHLV